MRIRLVFKVKNPGTVIPFHHQYVLAAIFKSLLESEGNWSETGKEYNFSALKGQMKAEKDGLFFLSNKATVVFSSPDINLIERLIRNVFNEKCIYIGQLILEPSEIERELPMVFDTHEVKYVCLSPLVLANPEHVSFSDNKLFVEPGTNEFSDLLYESTIGRMEQTGKYTDKELACFNKFQLVPDKDFIAKARSSGRKFSRIYGTFLSEMRYEVRGYIFPFTLYAEPEIHNFIFNSGLGELASSGFGMLDKANTEFNKRTVPYFNLDKTA